MFIRSFITVACVLEWVCYLCITLSICGASRRRPISGFTWICGYAICSGWGRLLTAFSLWSPVPLRPLQAAWHLVTATAGIGATYHLLRFTRKSQSVHRLEDAVQSVVLAIDAQQLVDTIPFPSAAMTTNGEITAINSQFASLLGCKPGQVERLRWIRYFEGRDRLRILASPEHDATFEEKGTWRRPSDGQSLQISARGLMVGSQLICSVADISLIPKPGGLP